MSASIEIRKAVLTDAIDIATIHCESWKSAYKNILSSQDLDAKTNIAARVEKEMRVIASGASVYIAFLDNKPVGIMSYCQSRNDDLVDYAEIVSIHTLESVWGKGVGKLMMHYALAELKRLGFERVMLWTFETNNRARRFYEKCSFVADGAVRDSGFSNVKEVRYRLELALFQETEKGRRTRIYPVILSEYNPAWSEWYTEEKTSLERMIGTESIARISHFGSTSVPGLTAKPTIDILLEIKESADIEKLKAVLPSSEYICLCGAGLTMPTPPPHLMFLKGYLPDGFAEKVYHIHVRYSGDWDELYFRDYLIAHPETAAEYAKLKVKLHMDFKHDRDGYTKAKTAFILEVTQKARKL